ncbi:hypothetical protein D3C71_1842140 [compost metagenome]
MISVRRQHSILPCCILVRTVRIHGAEQPHIVAAVSSQSAVGYIQVVIAGCRVIYDIRTFAGFVIAAGNFGAEVTVNQSSVSCSPVFAGIYRLSGRRVNLEQENAA